MENINIIDSIELITSRLNEAKVISDSLRKIGLSPREISLVITKIEEAGLWLSKVTLPPPSES